MPIKPTVNDVVYWKGEGGPTVAVIRDVFDGDIFKVAHVCGKPCDDEWYLSDVNAKSWHIIFRMPLPHTLD